MSNSFFQFKQFTIHQERCAMKVCTDACLLGAWVAEKIKDNRSIKNIADIGAGTGLLSLMLAQKTTAHIDAIELNKAAAEQAAENFNDSPWKERLTINKIDINEFYPEKKYDCIISNPPFFETDLKSEDPSKNAAKHDTTLTLDVLLGEIKRLLKEDGTAAILLPFHRMDHLENLLNKNGFFVNHKMLVQQTSQHGYFRTMLIFSENATEITEEELFIHDAQREYSESFTRLLKDFYLKL